MYPPCTPIVNNKGYPVFGTIDASICDIFLRRFEKLELVILPPTYLGFRTRATSLVPS